MEVLLDHLWSEVIGPLSGEIGGAEVVRFRLPQRWLRLPITTARHAESGASLIHMTEPLIDWSHRAAGLNIEPRPVSREVLRIDGHLRQVASRLAGLRVAPNTIVLMLGCRTAQLADLIASTGAGSAVVTSWDVEDRHCRGIGDALEERIRAGQAPGAALRSVQALRSSEHPYEWAGYSLVDFSGGDGT